MGTNQVKTITFSTLSLSNLLFLLDSCPYRPQILLNFKVSAIKKALNFPKIIVLQHRTSISLKMAACLLKLRSSTWNFIGRDLTNGNLRLQEQCPSIQNLTLSFSFKHNTCLNKKSQYFSFLSKTNHNFTVSDSNMLGFYKSMTYLAH